MEHLILLAVVVAVIAAERHRRLRFERSRMLRRHFATDLFYLATGGVGLALLLRAAAVRGAEGWGALVPAIATWPGPIPVVVAVVAYDLSHYASHLLLHRVAALWRFHQVHHSSLRLDWLATFRAHAVEHGLRHLASSVALILAGFPVRAVATAAAIHTGFAVVGHSNLRLDLRFLEPVFITPRLHRLHHVTTTCERNLGSIFSWWDRLRGTLVTDPTAPTQPLGVPGRTQRYPQEWIPQLVEPFRTDRSRLEAASS